MRFLIILCMSLTMMQQLCAADALTVNGSSTSIDKPTAITKPLSITDATDSTTSSTGAVKVTGGVGVAKNLNVGGNTMITGTLKLGTGGATVNELSTDDTLAGNSDAALPTEKAVKTYVDSKQVAYVYVEAQLGSNQSVTSGQTNISYSNEIHDDDNLWSGTVFTAPSTGIYAISASSYVGAYDNEVKMYVNGVHIFNGNRSWVPTLSVFQLLNQDDEVTFRINHSGTRTAPSLNQLRIVKIR